MKTRRTKRKSRRGGSWSIFENPRDREATENVQREADEQANKEANDIAIQIKQNVLSGETPRYVTRSLYSGKDKKKIKLALTKQIAFLPHITHQFDYIYDDLEPETTRWFTSDKEADEIMDYLQKDVSISGIRYLLSRSKDFMKLKMALSNKANLKIPQILRILDDLQLKKESNAFLINKSRWSDE